MDGNTDFLKLSNIFGVQPPQTENSSSDISGLLNQMRGGVSSQESSSGKSLVNPDSGALGPWQVMPANVPSWTKKHYGQELKPDQFLNNPAAQRAVFDGEMGSYLKEAKARGVDDDTAIRMAASKWYSGSLNKYDDPTPQYYNGRAYPSIQSYTKSVLNKSKGQQDTNLSTTDFDNLSNAFLRSDNTDADNSTSSEQQPPSPQSINFDDLSKMFGVQSPTTPTSQTIQSNGETSQPDILANLNQTRNQLQQDLNKAKSLGERKTIQQNLDKLNQSIQAEQNKPVITNPTPTVAGTQTVQNTPPVTNNQPNQNFTVPADDAADQSPTFSRDTSIYNQAKYGIQNPASPTISHRNPQINGKSIVAQTADVKAVVANPNNKSGVSIVKNQPADQPVDLASPENSPDLEKDLANVDTQVKAEGGLTNQELLQQQYKEAHPDLINANNDNDILSKGSAGTVNVDLSSAPKGEDAARFLVKSALQQVAPKYDITNQEIEQELDSQKKETGGYVFDSGTGKIADADINNQIKNGNTKLNYTVTDKQINDILNRRNNITDNSLNPDLKSDVQMNSVQAQQGQPNVYDKISQADAEERQQIADEIKGRKDQVNNPQNKTFGDYVQGIIGNTLDPIGSTILKGQDLYDTAANTKDFNTPTPTRPLKKLMPKLSGANKTSNFTKILEACCKILRDRITGMVF